MMRRLTSGPNPSSLVLAVVVKQTAHFLSAEAVPHSIESGEVRRGFGGSDNIVGAQSKFGVR